MSERHLGLVTPEDSEQDESRVHRLASAAEQYFDLDRLLLVTRNGAPQTPIPSPRTASPSKRVGVARDEAFCFYYEENLRILREAGAQLVEFRPCAGDRIPDGLDGLYLGGGYPEVHARRLTRNQAFLRGLRKLHEIGAPIYAECGGFMTLCRGLTDPDGEYHPMAGVFPVAARMNQRAFRLGYREVRAETGAVVSGLTVRGHEFHYSHVDDMPKEVPRIYRVCNARGEQMPPEGYLLGNTLAGYIHLHFASCPDFPARFFGLTPPP